MKDKKFVTIKVVAAISVLAIFIIGALFFTKLMPPINKTQAAASPQTVPAIGAAKVAIETEQKSVVASNDTASETSGTAVLGDSTTADESGICRKTKIAYDTVYKKVSWLEKGTSKLKKPGRPGYKIDCSDNRSSSQGETSVAPISQEVYVGTGVSSAAANLVEKLQKIINAID